MSYRQPAIIQNQSGLIVPQALAKAAENISQAWSKQLSDQRQLNLARKEEDRKNDLLVEDATAKANAALKKGTGGKNLVDSARETQVQIINDLDEILKELNNRDLDPDRKKLLRAAELELMNGLADMNATFPKITTTMQSVNDYNINKAGSLGKVTPTTENNLNFGLGLKEEGAKYIYNGYKRGADGKLVLGGSNDRGLTISSGGVEVDANQFTSDGWTALTDVTQIQPDINLATKNKLTGKGGAISPDALETATYEMEVPVYNEAGKKVSTKTVMNQAATEETNQFLNEQTELAFAAIQSVQDPTEARNILKNQYNMSENDIDTFLNVKDAGMAAMTNTTLSQEAVESVLSNFDDVNSKLRFSIAQTIATPLNLSITNPDDAAGAYTFGKETQGSPAAKSSGGDQSELDKRIAYSRKQFKNTKAQNRNISNVDLFTQAGNFAVGKSLIINGQYRDVRGVSSEGDIVRISYGNVPNFNDQDGDEDKELLRQFAAAKNNPGAVYREYEDPSTNLKVQETYRTALADAGLTDSNELEVDLTNRVAALPGIRKAFNITEEEAGKLFDTYFYTPPTTP